MIMKNGAKSLQYEHATNLHEQFHIHSYSDWLYKSYDPYINDQILHSCTAILHVITKHISPTIIAVITSKPLSISLEMVNGNTNIVIQESAMWYSSVQLPQAKVHKIWVLA